MNRLMAVDWSPKNKINDPVRNSTHTPRNNNNFQFAYSQAVVPLMMFEHRSSGIGAFLVLLVVICV